MIAAHMGTTRAAQEIFPEKNLSPETGAPPQIGGNYRI